MSWVHAVIDVPEAAHREAGCFWGAALGWAPGEPWPGHPELRSFEPARGSAYVHLQRIGGPARVHLDVESDMPDRTVADAVELGATVTAEQDRWRTLVSPGGLPFCVLHVGEHRSPDPVAWPDGHRSRLVQVAIDSPAAAHEHEVAFWRALLAGRWVDSSVTEFAGKWHDDAGSPLQLLFQRLEEPTGRVRAHLDHGTDDVAAEVDRLCGLGAVELHGGRGWQTLRDPAGLEFCVTGNAPDRDVRRDLS
ncbi:VOC family protein [Nocardioides sp. URHA0020]|uniref:VOC family protein n=1 Tax=Nocardioides sp. URHA0020 TaxID=1380392 RepID=UPI0006891260|nr:VOC family protein [Nocardioides sp. URHA0020]